MTTRENDVPEVYFEESGEPRGHTRRLFAYTALGSLLTVGLVWLVDIVIGGVHR